MSLLVLVAATSFLRADVTPAPRGSGADTAYGSLNPERRYNAMSRVPAAPPLERFPAGPMVFRDYGQDIYPIEGPQPKLLPGWTFSFDNVIITPEREIITRITEGKNAAFKWETEKSRFRTTGRYVVEATLPKTRPGVVAAPLWLYSEGAPEGGHEFDFELMNGRIEYNMHNGNGGFNMKKVRKDLGGHRVRFEIDRRPDRVIMRIESLTDGFRNKLTVTPRKVSRWAKRKSAPANLRWPPNDTPMFPVMEFWVAKTPGWAGVWKPLPPGESLDMVIHGYSVSEIQP